MKKLFAVLAVLVLVLAAVITASAEAEEDHGLDPVTLDAASVRLSGDTGMRFQTTLSRTAWDALKKDPSVAHLKVGTLIAPAVYVEKAGAFTKEALDLLDGVSGAVYLEAETSGTDTADENFWPDDTDDDRLSFVGSIVSLKESHYDTPFSAIGYVRITYTDGTVETVYAKSYATRTIREVARKVLTLPQETLLGLEYSNEQLGLLYDFGAMRLDFAEDIVTGIGSYIGAELLIPTVTPDGMAVSGIDWMAFSGCEEITSLFVGEGIWYIDGYAFFGCTNLARVSLPGSLERLVEGAFLACPCVETVDGISYVDSWAVEYSGTAPEVVLRDGTSGIADAVFSGNRTITSVTFPASLAVSGYEAFYGCINLSAVRITDLAAWCNILFTDFYANPLCCAHNLYLNGVLLTDCVIPSGVTEIRDYAFVECTPIVSLTVPDSVAFLDSYAFYGCSQISFLDLGKGLEGIGTYAFYGCKALTVLTIPSGVTNLPLLSFGECSGLTEINLPAGLLQIGDGAFRKCVSLEAITIPSSVVFISYEAFARCSKLQSAVFESPDGWWYADDAAALSGTEITGLDDPSGAAVKLSDQYSRYYWKRSNQQ